MITRKARIKRNPTKRRPTKRRKGDDPEYREWLRQQRCVVCQDTNPEVAHVGARGVSQKCPDRQAVPLCPKHHRHVTAGGGPESHHTLGKRFWDLHNLDRDDVVSTLNHLYLQETGK